MKGKLFTIALTGFGIVFALLIGLSLWYYTVGRKPKLLVSTRITEKTGSPSSHATAPGEMLLITGGKATLYDTTAGKEKWRSDLSTPTPSATPAAASTLPSTATLKSMNDPMRQILDARIARRSAKLDQWRSQLNGKRNSLNTPLKVASFKQEEAKYEAELDEVRAAKLAMGQSLGSETISGYKGLPDRRIDSDDDSFGYGREILRIGSAIVVTQGRSVRLLDAVNGRLTKEISLPGNVQQVMRGRDCIYVLASGNSGAQQLSRIGTGNGAAQILDLTGVNAESWPSTIINAGEGPDIAPKRTAFSAAGEELAQIDVRLLEKKITERQAIKTDSAADWEAADKNTTGGWSNDAAEYAKAIANDAQREVTGGKELVDESTYEVLLRRPFAAGIPETPPIKVHGRPALFSTPSFDLVTAGRSLIAFDHNNKKLWEATIAFPIAAVPSLMEEFEASGPGTLSQPCLEDDKRLYVFDQGFLNAFDRQTGKTLWRLPSVGIHKVQLDSGGLFDSGPVLYVSSANRSVESLQYSQQATASTLPILFKLDPNTGKVLWKVDKYEDCFVSGGNVYVTHETRNAADLVNSVFQSSQAIATRFKLYKLSARDGQPQWEWFQTRRPLRIEADKKKVSLLFADELQVLTSRAL